MTDKMAEILQAAEWNCFFFRNTLGWVKVNLTACELSIFPTRLSPTISFLRNPETLQVLSRCWACCLTYCQQLPINATEMKLRASVFCPCLLHCCCFNKHWTMFCETCLVSLLTYKDSSLSPITPMGRDAPLIPPQVLLNLGANYAYCKALPSRYQ